MAISTITGASTGSTGTVITTGSPQSGGVIQVVSAYTNSGYTSTTSTSYVATTLSVSITPKFSTSKFLVFINGGIYQGTGGTGYYSIFRNGGNVLNNQIENQVLNTWLTTSGHIYDTPATASTLTYAVYMKASSNTTYWGADSPLTNFITVMEISA